VGGAVPLRSPCHGDSVPVAGALTWLWWHATALAEGAPFRVYRTRGALGTERSSPRPLDVSQLATNNVTGRAAQQLLPRLPFPRPLPHLSCPICPWAWSTPFPGPSQPYLALLAPGRPALPERVSHHRRPGLGEPAQPGRPALPERVTHHRRPGLGEPAQPGRPALPERVSPAEAERKG